MLRKYLNLYKLHCRPSEPSNKHAATRALLVFKSHYETLLNCDKSWERTCILPFLRGEGQQHFVNVDIGKVINQISIFVYDG